MPVISVTITNKFLREVTKMKRNNIDISTCKLNMAIFGYVYYYKS